ncbi:MAG TPA: ABC transporter permease [Gemmatimonadaceae bacterium]|nr:ABC transporter permease [Gemmatimonadaceae bacterium]
MGRGRHRAGAGERLLRLALGAYPPAFRARFGAEMLETHREQWRAARGEPASRRLRIVARAALDLLASAAAERVAERRERRARSVAVPSHCDTHRSTNRGTTMRSLAYDLRFALRSLGRRPGFVAAVVVTLALGIGANTAIFSLVDAVLLHPLSVVHEPERVVAVYQARSAKSPYGAMAYPTYRDLAERSRTLAGLAVFFTTDAAVDAGGRAEQHATALVSGNYFGVLGLRPTLGRLLGPQDDAAPGASPSVVLGHDYWTSRFGGDPDVVGRTIRIGGSPFTIVGVAPRGFRGTELVSAPDLWVPMAMHRSLSLPLISSPEALETRFLTLFSVVGRLRDDVTSAQAAAELNAVFAQIQRESPAPEFRMGGPPPATPISVLPAAEGAVRHDRDSLVRFVRLLLGTVVLTLLLACVNVANLLLVRGAERAAELGIRVALGAARRRIVRQLFVESLLLALGGAAAGLVVGALTMRLLSAFTLPGGIALDRVGLALDGRVLAFTIVLAVLTAVAFGLVPALRAARVDPASAMRAQGARATRRAPRGVLLGVQVAISLVLLVGAALFLRSVRAGLATDIGFDPRPLAAISMEPRLSGFETAQQLELYRDAMTRAGRIPGVTAVAAATHVPLARLVFLPFGAGPDGATGPDGKPVKMTAGVVSVTPGYFATLGVPLRAGRDFTAADDEDAPDVAILNESAARAFFGDAPAVGGQLTMWGDARYTVVGVVRDTKYESVRDEAVPSVFRPLAQESGIGGVSIIARAADPERAPAVLAALREAVRAADPSVPLRDARLVARQIDAVLMPQRFGATLLSIFALVALAISAVGIHGTVAYTVSQRTTEIGIRGALGAQRGDILRLVLRRTAVALVLGALTGGALALAGTRAVAHFLYGVAPTDTVAFAAALGVLVVTGLVVAIVPARRATRIDPVRAMRSQ